MKHLSALLRILNEVNEMYIYEYVEVGLSNFLSTNAHRSIINDYASKGWRYVGSVPNRTGGYGQLKSNDLVFERYVEESSTS